MSLRRTAADGRRSRGSGREAAGRIAARRRTRPERLRSLLDTGTVFVGGATFLWYVALGPAVASRPGFDLPGLVIFAYPIGDRLLLFGVLSLLWRGVPRASGRVPAAGRPGVRLRGAAAAGDRPAQRPSLPGGCWRLYEDTEQAAVLSL